MSERPQPVSMPVPSLDLHAMKTTYSNYFRASRSAEEVILDFGVDGHHHTANGPEPIQMLQRLILPWSSAQQLFVALQQMLQQRNKMEGIHSSANHPPNQATPPPL